MSKYECVSIQGNLKHVEDYMNEIAKTAQEQVGYQLEKQHEHKNN